MVKIEIDEYFEILTTVTFKPTEEPMVHSPRLKITYDGAVLGSPIKIFLITREKGSKEPTEILFAESKEYE